MKIKSLIFYKEQNSNFEDAHPIVELYGQPNIKFRARSEILVVRGSEVYLSIKKRGLCSYNSKVGYDVAGGGWQENETPETTAVRESKEESRILAVNPQYVGDYIVKYNEPHPWVKENIPKDFHWRGYYTQVFIGKYSGLYSGPIDERDQDELIKTGKFFKINAVIDFMHPVHKDALTKYLESL